MDARKRNQALPDSLHKMALEPGTEVDLTLEDGRLPAPAYVEDLLPRITPEDLHPETNTGPSVGNEAW